MKIYCAQVEFSYPETFHDALSVFGQTFHCPVIRDRFGFLNQFSPWNLSDKNEPFPVKKDPNTFDLELMLFTRASSYLEMIASGSQLIFAYSGGVDSTTMMTALIHAAITKGYVKDKNFHINVLHTKSSIEENPQFWSWMQTIQRRAGSDFIHLFGGDWDCGTAIKTMQDKGYTVISGFPADQLFGSIMTFNEDVASEYHKPWKDWKKCFDNADDAIDQYSEAFKHYGLPIETVGQYLWFMNFTTKWRVTLHFDCFICGQDKAESLKGFYDTEEFASWSVSNFELFHHHPETEVKYYKVPFKNYVKNTCSKLGLAYEFPNKKKAPSWGNSYKDNFPMVHPSFTVIAEDDNGNLVVDRMTNNRILLPMDDPIIKHNTNVLGRNLLRKYRRTK